MAIQLPSGRAGQALEGLGVVVKGCDSLGLLNRRLSNSSLAELKSLEGLGIDGNPQNLPPVKGMDLWNHGRA